jgi:O-antigen ligase
MGTNKNRGYELTNIVPILSIIFFLCIPPFFSGGRNFYIQEISSWLLACSILLSLKKIRISKKNKYIYLSLLSFIILSFASSFLSVSPYNSLVYSANYLVFVLVFIIASAYRFTEEKLIRIFKIFLWSNLLICGIGFYYLLTQDFPRITSTFYWPNPLAGYLLFTIPISLYLFFSRNSKLGLISFFVSILTLIFTGSRGAFLSLGLSFLFISLTYFLTAKKDQKIKIYYSIKTILKKNFKNIILCFLATLFLFVLITSLKNNINFLNRYNKNGQPLDYSSAIRLNYWQGAINIFKSRPIFGSGPDTFYIAYPKFQKNILSSGKYAHNWFLEILSENGLLGIITFLIFLGLIYYNYFRKNFSLLNNCLMIGATASLLHNLLDFDWHFYANSYIFYFIIGLSINEALYKDNSREGENKKISLPVKLIIVLIALIAIFKSFLLINENFNFLNTTELNNTKNSVTESYFQKNIRFKNPEYVRDYLQYLISIKSKSSLDKADKISLELIETEKDFAYNSFLRAEVMFLKENYTEAIKNFDQAIKLDKVNYPEFYYLLAINYLKQGKKEEAKELLLDGIKYYTPEMLNDKKYIITNNQKLETSISKKASLLYSLLSDIYSSENNTPESNKFSTLADKINPGE